MADPFAQYLAPEPKGADPFAQYVAPDAAAPTPAPAPAEKPSFLEEAGSRAKNFLSSLTNVPTLHDVGQSFKDLGSTVAGANDFAARALVHPVDTFGGDKAGAVLREAMRGVNSNIPFANLAVEHMGGPAETSAADTAAAPGAQQFGAIAGTPVAGMAGEIAAKVVGAAAPLVSKAIKGTGEAAETRGTVRALDKLEERVNKRARAGIQTEPVEALVRENPEIAKAAGNDTKLAVKLDAVRGKASAELGHIYSSATPEIDMAVPVMKMDARITELMKGTSEDAEQGRQLQKIRDELNDRIGARDAVTPRELRDEQTAYQRKGYGKAMPGDDAATARIAANREASKAVGDAVLEHVTGMDYAAAKEAAAKDPASLAARLLKANDTISAANKIEAGMADRASRIQPAHGPLAALKRIAGHAAIPIVAGAASHSPMMALGAAVGQEALHAAPGVARATVGAIDRGIAAGAPVAAGAADIAGAAAAPVARALPLLGAGRPSDLLEQLLARADSGDAIAKAKLDALARAPIVAARIDALRHRRAPMEARP